ncbi:MAG: XDD4 family exosortase-dependent surface protein [Planctomycetia bacterium]
MHTLCLTHRIVLATKVLLPWIGILVAATVFAVLPAEGGTIISGTGQTLVSTSPNVYRTVSASADLSISGTTLTVVLNNTSPTDTIFRAEALSSFYFDIVRNSQRPTLTYTSADGALYKLSSSGSDTQYWYSPQTFSTSPKPTDLRAFNTNDGSWQFKAVNPAFSPFLGFGIGTVGNSLFNNGVQNGFNGDVVSGPGQGNTMIDFSIYRSLGGGDISPGNGLDGNYLLKNSGTFTFGIVSNGIDWSTADIRKEAVFGFGTGPDGIITVTPEPSAYAIALIGVAAVACRQRFRRKGRVHHAPVP